MRCFSLLLPAALCLFIVSACTKTSDDKCLPVTATAPSSEVAQLQAFISASGITAQSDPRGFFYTIVRPGTGAQPTVCSSVTAAYTGRLSTGQQFDASAGAKFNLQGVIAGWQEGVPLIGEGGSIILYLPPSLGYGATARTGIPANSITVFSIDLLKVE